MKNKPHTCKWVMALCAVAFFSFTAAGTAEAIVRKPIDNPNPYYTIDPLPAPPAADSTSPVGTSTGSVSID